MVQLLFCKQCENEGETSTITGNGYGTSTLMDWYPSYDEQGRYHSHNPNWHTSSWRCSRGHVFTVRSKNGCSSCGYGSKVEQNWVGKADAE